MIQDRLENWARYFRVRLQLKTCGSLEGRYRSNWRQYVELHEIKVPEPIDWQDAELVEQAWKQMLGKSKLLLKYHYLSGFPDYIVARKSGIKRWEYNQELNKAEKIIAKVLDRIENEAYKEENLNRASETIHRNIGGSVRPKESQADDMVWLFAF